MPESEDLTIELLNRKCERYHKEVEAKDDEISALKSKLEDAKRIQDRVDKREFWAWQNDGENFPESLACPVIMNAHVLRELLNDAVVGKAAHELLKEWREQKTVVSFRQVACAQPGEEGFVLESLTRAIVLTVDGDGRFEVEILPRRRTWRRS